MPVEDAIGDARPRVIGALVGYCRDLDLAEEGFAEAVAALLAQEGVTARPANIAGWLYVAARRRIVDMVRRDSRRAALLAREAVLEDVMGDVVAFPGPIPDERLRLIFVCTHPAIAPDIRIALALHTVCGVPMERLAAAFLVPAPTLYQRLGRAKAKIREAGIGFEVPGRRAWPERLAAVLDTLELGYSVAYADGAGALDADLAPEVRRLAALLVDIIPDEPEVLGLMALIELAESRRAARADAAGMMVPLSRQDSALWDGAAIMRARALLDRAAVMARSGPRQIIAAIHLTHARRAPGGGAPDWQTIVRLYDLLCAMRPGPASETARAVAIARLDGAAAGLAALDAIAPASVAHHRGWFSARGHLLAEMGQAADARVALNRALALGPPPAEASYLAQMVARLSLHPVSSATS